MGIKVSQGKLRILWVSTNYYPSPGGASVYLKLLGSVMDASPQVEQVTILAEAYPGQPDVTFAKHGKVQVRRVFPFRGGAEKKDLVAYWKYGIQNLKLLQIPRLAKKLNVNVVVIHSWYFLFPSVLPFIVNQLKKHGVKLVADMRDANLPVEKFKRLEPFDALLGCGQRVIDHFSSTKSLAAKLHSVAVPLEQFSVESDLVIKTLEKYKLAEDGYVFAPIGISNHKRFSLLFDAWRHLLGHGHKLDLVIAGRNRDWQKRYEEIQEGGKLVLTGSIDRADIHGLYAGAALSLNPSNNESFGRVPAEAIPHGKPILFPAGVPEYNHILKDLICNTSDPSELAGQMERAIAQGRFGGDYDLSKHVPETVALKTLEILDRLIETQ